MCRLSLLLVIAWLPIYGQSEAPKATNKAKDTTEENHPVPKSGSPASAGNIPQVDKVGSKKDEGKTADPPETYLQALISPNNLPNLILAFVGIAGIIAAVCTLRWLKKQTEAIRQQADLMKIQVSLMQVPYRQRIEFENWRTEYGSNTGGLRILVDIVNPTDFPMTINEGCIQFTFRNGGSSKLHIVAGYLLSPRKPHALDIRIPVGDEDGEEMRNGMLPIPTRGLFSYWGPLGESVVTKQTLVGQINCGKYGTRFIAVAQTTEEQATNQEDDGQKAN